MGTSFEDILNRMRNAPHVGVPAVANPKLPTKVERDAAAIEARQREMPKFHFGTGTPLEKLVEHMKNAPHPTPKYADPAFRNGYIATKEDIDAFEEDFHTLCKRLDSEKGEHISRKANLPEMKIYVIGGSKNTFLPMDDIRTKFLVDKPHDGDNIDFLNPWYCELTGMYYLWKHCDAEIVGIEHYRNYFWKHGKPITKQEITDELKKGDIICGGYAYPAWNKPNLRVELDAQTKGALPAFIDILRTKDKGLSEYFDKYLNGQRIWCCNMFIGHKKIFDEWMEFAINLLLDFEHVSKIGPATNTWRREGYFTEFLFGAWLEYKGYKIVHCDMNKFTKDLSRTEFMVMGPNKRLNFQ